MLRGRDIIFIGSCDWEEAGIRERCVVNRLTENNRVLYVEPITSRMLSTLGPKTLKKKFRGVKKNPEVENLHVWSAPISKSKKFARKLSKIVKQMSLDTPVIYTTLPESVNILDYFTESQVIYDSVGREHRFANAKNKDLQRELEKRLIRTATLVFTAASGLYNEFKEINSDCYLLTNGAQVGHYAALNSRSTTDHNSRPDETFYVQAGIKEDLARQLGRRERPHIGFIGGIGEWVDLPLIQYLADNRPDWVFLMVGPLAEEPGDVYNKQNVIFTGYMPYKQLPYVLQSFDVATCPFVFQQAGVKVSPNKVTEYLAGGKPVVVTKAPNIRAYEEYVYAAESNEVFLEHLEQALKREQAYRREGMLPSIKRMRKEFAWAHSFDEQIKRMEALWNEQL